jgi:hypothetical protein
VRLRGAGLSERSIGPLSLDTSAEDLDAVLPALDLDRVALVAAVHQSEHGLPPSTQHLREDRDEQSNRGLVLRPSAGIDGQHLHGAASGLTSQTKPQDHVV